MCTYIQEKTFGRLKNTYLACCINIRMHFRPEAARFQPNIKKQKMGIYRIASIRRRGVYSFFNLPQPRRLFEARRLFKVWHIIECCLPSAVTLSVILDEV